MKHQDLLEFVNVDTGERGSKNKLLDIEMKKLEE
jgi:hypothetical protein